MSQIYITFILIWRIGITTFIIWEENKMSLIFLQPSTTACQDCYCYVRRGRIDFIFKIKNLSLVCARANTNIALVVVCSCVNWIVHDKSYTQRNRIK